MAEYVYFLRDVNTGLTKIGKSIHPHARQKDLEYEFKTKLEPIAVAKTHNALELEKSLHERFKDSRVSGEWFDLDKPLKLAREVLADKLLDWSEAVRVTRKERKSFRLTMTPEAKTVQGQLKEYAYKNDISLKEMGEKLNPSLSRQHVFSLLNSKNKSVPAKLVELIDALGLTLELKVKA